jgi:hypothetical protein
MTGWTATILTCAGENAKPKRRLWHLTAMSGLRSGILLILSSPAFCQTVNVPDIVQRATAALQSDWAADAKYACIEKDETRRGAKVTSKTFEVVMIDGSEYHFPLAVDGQNLTPDQRRQELAKLGEEIRKRRGEGAPERARRIERWKKERDENGELLLDFPVAFNFQFVREETKDGHAAWVLAATPKEGFPQDTRARKVLAGMRGTAWVEKETFHPIYVRCEVVKPVPVFGNLASVLPGTQIDISMTPVASSTPSVNIWLIDLVSMNLDVAKLHMFKSVETTRSAYTQYKLNGPALEELLAEARSTAK